MQPRYQIFVSSTFRDLREERQAALEAILELGHFPAGMETFPAADATPWELIKSIIADSDYYVLIVGAKYGSTGPDGISYTEMEFNLAVELGKPILSSVPAFRPCRVVLTPFMRNRRTCFCGDGSDQRMDSLAKRRHFSRSTLGGDDTRILR